MYTFRQLKHLHDTSFCGYYTGDLTLQIQQTASFIKHQIRDREPSSNEPQSLVQIRCREFQSLCF